MASENLVFRIHAIQRMFQRRISMENVRHVLMTGEVIEAYPDDTPYPSRLVLGWCGPRPLHVVAADNATASETIVISAYEPDPVKWDSSFRRRIRP
ncbi:MAG: DUF4258 domain-containing protein [candidate division NC10 bacterium]|nr:DUF4258 domain-containing protein [candidate division NC10 bacterium]